jgi:hypothetical protein
MDSLAGITEMAERMLCEASQLIMFHRVEIQLEDIAAPHAPAPSLLKVCLRGMAEELDYNMIGDPRVESQYAA